MEKIPVYFPMTYLSVDVEAALAACFRQTAVCRSSNRELPETMQAAVFAGRLVVYTPVKAESTRLLELVDAYHAWAQENRGVDLSVFKGNESRIPFYEDTAISKIRQDIREMGSESEKAQVSDPVFTARLFLEMAQDLDRQNDALERTLEGVREKENSMFANLLGDADGHPGIEAPAMPGGNGDPGAYMTGTRVQAWWRLFHKGAAPGNLLVTNSRAVIEYLVERCPGLQKTGRVFRLPPRQSAAQDAVAWQGRLLEHLYRMIALSETDDGPADIPEAEQDEVAVNLSTYRFERSDAAACFSLLEKPAGAAPGRKTEESLVICLVEAEGGVSKKL